MSAASDTRGPVGVRWRWLIWGVYVAAWTTALLMPVPHGQWKVEGVPIDFRYLVAKTIHVTAYALLAGLSGWLRVPVRYRVLLLFCIMAHGTLTELLQRLTQDRDGSLYDVGFDHLGIALGLLLTWKWWTEP
jgi:VanZ family protein